MCKELPIILVNRVVDIYKNNQKKWRAKEEEDNGSLAQKSWSIAVRGTFESET
jgi:hypothetical protein